MDERTTEILRRFADSWVETDDWFADLIDNYGHEHLVPVRQVIKKLKQDGGDKYFRLGTPVSRLLISRSVDAGLRCDQKFIIIETIKHDEFEVVPRDGDREYRKYRVNNLEDNRVEN